MYRARYEEPRLVTTAMVMVMELTRCLARDALVPTPQFQSSGYLGTSLLGATTFWNRILREVQIWKISFLLSDILSYLQLMTIFNIINEAWCLKLQSSATLELMGQVLGVAAQQTYRQAPPTLRYRTINYIHQVTRTAHCSHKLVSFAHLFCPTNLDAAHLIASATLPSDYYCGLRGFQSGMSKNSSRSSTRVPRLPQHSDLGNVS